MLEAENLNTFESWVDVFFAVHLRVRSHTGCLMMLRGGAVYTSSTEQRLITHSSTEDELDAMSQILWTQMYLAAQGSDYSVSHKHQDNQSAMLL